MDRQVHEGTSQHHLEMIIKILPAFRHAKISIVPGLSMSLNG